MNLLPRCHKDFSLAQYWEQFFKKRGDKAFEWYGEYADLCGILHKYIKPTDKVLVPGCGSSSLSADLYDVGCKAITNIDISDLVIKQMRDKYSNRKDMTWEKMDVNQTTFADGEFNVVLDKGTLDAIMTDDSPAVVDNVNKMFSEMNRVLRLGGRYLCVSLAQDHILQKVLTHFADEGWPVRVCRVTAERDDNHQFYMPVFVFVLTKFKKMENMKPILELCAFDDKLERKENVEQLINAVQAIQNYGIIREQLSKKNLQTEEQVFLELYNEESDEARYVMHVVDLEAKSPSLKFAVFIVPQGRETDFLFSCDEGRTVLAKQAGFQRLIVAVLSRTHRYDSLDSVKAELSSKVMELAPPGLGKRQVPFLSLGDEICLRQIRQQVESGLSGEIAVEDVSVDGTMYRRLVFLKTKHIVQSEVRLVQEHKKTKSGKKKKTSKMKVDSSHLAAAYLPVMVSGLSLLSDCVKRIEKGVSVLVIGMGSGSLSMFLQTKFPQIRLDVVELDPLVVKLANDWFGFSPNSQCVVHVADGLAYMKSQREQGTQYDVVIFDVDNKDPSVGMSPPKIFVEEDTLKNVKSLLKPEGIFILNLACRNRVSRQSVMDNMSTVFTHVHTKKMEQDVNEIVFALNSEHELNSVVSAETMRALQELMDKSQETSPCFDIRKCLEGLHLLCLNT